MKKAQIRMSETIAVLFIFFVLIIFGMIFYFKYQEGAIEQKQEELLAAKAMDVTLQTLFLPELICSDGEAQPERNCIDLMKWDHAYSTFREYLGKYYFDIFSYATITVTQVYPDVKDPIVLYDQPKPPVDNIPPNKEPTYFVVALRNDFDASYGYGYITVEVYS